MPAGNPTRASNASEREASKVSEVVVVVPSFPSQIIYVAFIPIGLVVEDVTAAEDVCEFIVLGNNNTKCKRSLLKNTEHVNKTKNFVARNGGQTSKPAKARYELKKKNAQPINRSL